MGIGQSKERGMLDAYIGNIPGMNHSKYSTQAGNQVLAGVTLAGTGFTATGEYSEKYVGGSGAGAGSAIAHANYEVFTKVTEQPVPPVFYD